MPRIEFELSFQSAPRSFSRVGVLAVPVFGAFILSRRMPRVEWNQGGLLIMVHLHALWTFYLLVLYTLSQIIRVRVAYIIFMYFILSLES